MLIDTYIETRMKCFGEKDKHCDDDCEEKCCFIEIDLCIMETNNRKNPNEKNRRKKEFEESW